MGFWSWLFGSLSEPSESAPTEPGRSDVRRRASGLMTAVAERSATQEQVSPNSDSAPTPWWTPQADALLEPAELQPPEPAADALVLENLLVSHFDGHDLSVPTLHSVVERVLPRLRGSECNFAAIARDIAEDQVLTAAVLRTVNSPFYRGVEKVSSVQRAVARLGTRTLHTLLMHQSLHGAIFDRRGAANRFAELLWRRSLASACIMRGLARFGRLDEDEAYLLGLLHDIGSVIVLRIVRTEEKGGFADVDLQTFEYLCRQSHQEFGELIAESWKLPADIKSLIAAHHTYPRPDDPLSTQRLMLILTDMIVSVLCFAPPGNYDLIQCRAARDLGLSDRFDYADWLTGLPAEIDDFIAES